MNEAILHAMAPILRLELPAFGLALLLAGLLLRLAR
jgi:hypothetical protein